MAKRCVERVRRIFKLLAKEYGVPKWRRSGPAIDVLIHTILSQNTNDRNSGEGFRRLKKAFPRWADVEKAPWPRIAAIIRVSGLANVKSRCIRKTLRRIREERGTYSLEFLKRKPMESARQYLLDIPGVGPKTAACVLVFSFGMPAFPVDTHIHRVTKRVGLIGPRVGAAEAHEALQAMVPTDRVYPFHMLVIRHGREVCRARNPQCGRCTLLRSCPYGRSTVKGGGTT